MTSLRRLLAIVGAALFGLAAATWVTPVAMADTFTLRIGSGHPSAPVAYVDSMEHFFVPEVVKRVRERTAHEVRFIEAYAGTVAKVKETLEAVEKGILDIGGWCNCFEPTKALGMNLPYFLPFTTPDAVLGVKVFRQLLTEFPELYQNYSAGYNQTLLGISAFENYGLGTNFQWERTSELEGHKILGAGPNLPWISGAGAVPVTTTLPTAYNQLDTGVGEGLLMFPSSYNGFKFHEPAPYFKITNFGAMPVVSLTMNNDTRARLPKEVVDIIDEVGREYDIQSAQNSMNRERAGLENMRKTGGIITELSRQAQIDWAQSMIDWPAERAQAIVDAESIDAKKIMRRYVEILKEAGHKFPVNYPLD